MKYAFLCAGSALAVAASFGSTQALAAGAATSAAAANAGTVGELIVVAEKREMSIERVPVAVTAFSAKQRALLGIQSVQDLTNYVPSLSWTTSNDRIYIRGIGRNSDNLNNTSGVAFYYNGIYYGASAAIELQKDDLFIASTEVDAGPQNTLHGSNADGGVVQFTSQKPTSTPYAEIRAGLGNYNRYYVEGVVSGPINDHLKFRLGGNFTSMTGGYYNNFDGPPQGGDSVLGGSGQTEYLEGQLEGHWDHFDFWTMLSIGDFAANSMQGNTIGGNIPVSPVLYGGYLPNEFYGLCAPSLVNARNAAGCGAAVARGYAPVLSARTLPITANNFPGNNPGILNPRTFIQEFNSINDMSRNVQLSINATYHFPTFDVTYLGGYQQFHYVLLFPDTYGSGLTSYTQGGLSPTDPLFGARAGLCAAGGFSLAQCEAPLVNNTTGTHTLFNEYDQSFSHELDFTSTTDSKFQYVGGLYWYHERWNQPVWAGVDPNQAQMGAPDYLNFATGALTAAPVNSSFAGSTENTAVNYDSLAGFYQGIYKFNDQWKVTGAVRYTYDQKKGYQEWRFVAFDGGTLGPLFSSSTYGSATPAIDLTRLATASSLGVAYPGAGPAFINPQTGFAQRTLDASWGAWTGEADVDWTPDPSVLVYGKYSRGYKSGGWSTYTLGAQPETQPEYVDAFEMGAKKSTSTFTVNGDVFYYNYYNEQVPLTVANGATGQLIPILYNVPVVHDYGLELTGLWRPIDPLTLSVSYSYLNATIANAGPCVEDVVDPMALLPGANKSGCGPAKGGVQLQNLKGQQIPEAVPNKVSVNALYTLDFNPGKLALSGTFIWKDATYANVFNRSYAYQPSFTQVNLNVTWTSADDRYNIIAYCNNLFNTLGYEGAAGTLMQAEAVGQTPDILDQATLTPPRTFGLEFEYRWQ